MLRASGGSTNGKLRDVAQAERGHLQDDRREVGAQDLRLGELGPGRRSPPRCTAGCRCRPRCARSGPCAGWPTPARSARSAAAAPWSARLYREMRAVPGSITYRMPGTVSEVSATLVASTTRGRPERCGVEDPVLLGGGQPRVQRQHLEPPSLAVPSASAVSRISRSPDRKTRMSPGPSAAQLVDRVAIACAWSRLGVGSPRRPAAGTGPRPGRCGRTPRRPARRRSAAENRSGSMVAEVMMTLRSGRRGSSCLR